MATVRNKFNGVLVGVPIGHPALNDERWEVVSLEDEPVLEAPAPPPAPEPQAEEPKPTTRARRK